MGTAILNRPRDIILEAQKMRLELEPLILQLGWLERTRPFKFIVNQDGSWEREVVWDDESAKYRDEILNAIEVIKERYEKR